MRKFRKYTATALVAMMVAGMTMSGYQPADVSASQESEYIIVTKDKKSMKTVESKYNTMIDTQDIRKMDSDVIIIFVTNMPQFALKGYQVDALDYVLKPLSYYAFSQRLARALERMPLRWWAIGTMMN